MSNASALVPVIGQGDAVYLGETVDISLAPSWPDYAVAWCEKDGYGCLPPNQVVSITGNMHKYYIDPNVFNYGTYYRWSGEWSRGENLMAFVVQRGNRTAITAPTSTPIPAPTEGLTISANVSRVIKDDYSKLVVARGDTGMLEYYNSEVSGNGHLWLFGGDEFVHGGTHAELDLPLSFRDGSYYYYMDTAFTNGLDYGNYTGYLQFDGANKFQDVFYVKDYKTPFNATYPILDSIYKDVPAVSIHGLNTDLIKSHFKRMVTDPKYSDDYLVPIELIVTPPQIIIRDYYEQDDVIYITGLTSLNRDATITAVINPDHYPLAKDLKKYTYEAINITGSIHTMRSFNIEMDIPWEEMDIGMQEIEFTGYGYQNDIVVKQTLLFKVSDIYIMPTPTPKRERVVLDDYGWHRITPEITTVPTTPPIVPDVPKLGNVSYDGGLKQTNLSVVNAKANVTTQIPKPAPTPVPTMTVPINPMLGVLSLIIAMIVLRRE